MHSHLLGLRYLGIALNVTVLLWALQYLSIHIEDPWHPLGFLAGYFFLYQVNLIVSPIYNFLYRRYQQMMFDRLLKATEEEPPKND